MSFIIVGKENSGSTEEAEAINAAIAQARSQREDYFMSHHSRGPDLAFPDGVGAELFTPKMMMTDTDGDDIVNVADSVT